MNIAFCVAAHTDPLQLARLLKRLFRIGDVFLHIDVKARGLFDQAHLQSLCPAGRYFRVLSVIDVKWGGVRAEPMDETAI